jgi:hypothetical protein
MNRNKERVLVAAVVAVTASLAGLAIVMLGELWTYSNQLRLLSVAFIGLATVPFLITKMSGRRIDYGEPIYIISFLYVLCFPLRALYILHHPAALTELGPRPYKDFLDSALVVAALGYVLILAGYYLGIGQHLANRLPSMPQHLPRRGVVPKSFLLIGIGMGAWLYQLIVVGRVHGRDDWFTGNPFENLVIQLSAFVGYGVALLAIVFFRDLKTGRRISFVALAIAVGCSAYIAMALVVRVELAIAALAIALAWNYRFRPLRARSVIGAGVIVLCVVFPVLGTARGLTQQGLDQSRTSTGALTTTSLAIHQLTKDGVGGYFDQTMDRLGERFHGADSLAAVLKYTPGLRPFQYGKTYPLIVPPLTFVPRAVWHGKPQAFNEDFAPVYFGAPKRDVHIAVFNLADLYMNFAWPGLILGAFVLGCIYRLVYDFFIVRSGASEVGVFIYIFFFFQMTLIELEITTPLSQMLKSLLFLLPIVWFMRLQGSTAHRVRPVVVGETA